MRVTSIRPQYGSSLLATFDVELNEDVTLLNVALKQTNSGIRVFPAQGRDRSSTAFLAPDMAEQIAQLALTKLEAAAPYACT